jgi:DNA-binding transcriptional LysR family regulator
VDIYKLFTLIVANGSFNRTAEQIGSTQPTISKRIDRLEDELGVQLFKRSTRALLLTPAGKQFYERAQQIAALVEQSRDDVRKAAELGENDLRIATTASMAANVFPTVFSRLRQEYPDAAFHLSTNSNSDYYISRFRLEFDLFVFQGEGVDSDMSSRRLATAPLHYWASPEYLQRFGNPQSPEALKQHQFIAVRTPKSGNWHEKLHLQDTIHDRHYTITCNDNCSLVAHAEAGLGIMLAAKHLVLPALERGSLQALDVAPTEQSMPISALYRRNYLSPLGRAFLDTLIEHMAEIYPPE